MGKTIFVDGNPAQGQVGTLVTAAFLNGLQNHRHGGQDLDGSAPTDYAVGAGSANVYTATFTPALTAHCTGLPLLVKMSPTNTGASAFNPNGLGAKTIVRPDGTPLRAYDILAGGIYQLVYDGTNYQMTSIAPQAAISGAFRGLRASASGGAAAIAVAADEIIVGNSQGYQVLTGVSLSIAGTSVGANGLDTGTLAARTWYSLWVIYNPSSKTVAGLMSLSAATPTLPSGYTYKSRVGWIRTDDTNKYPLAFVQYGRSVQYSIMGNVAAYPQMASGAQGTVGSSSATTFAAIAVGAFVPPTAAAIKVSAFAYTVSGASIILNPSAAVTGRTQSAANQAMVNQGVTNTGMASWAGDIILESTNIYYACNSTSSTLNATGWEDNL